jgi:hypothetical protein
MDLGLPNYRKLIDPNDFVDYLFLFIQNRAPVLVNFVSNFGITSEIDMTAVKLNRKVSLNFRSCLENPLGGGDSITRPRFTLQRITSEVLCFFRRELLRLLSVLRGNLPTDKLLTDRKERS